MQMVHLEDIAWTNGGDGSYNDTGVSIEMEGHAEQTWFNSNMYGQVAEVIDWACATYGIPRHHPTGMAPCSGWWGDGGVISHSQVPAANDCSYPTSGKYDPGYTWDWLHIMNLVSGSVGGKFYHDQWIQATTDLNTRSEPGLYKNVVMTVPNGTWGQIVAGPVDKQGYTWWRVYWSDYDAYGWSVERYME
jgi:N-acetyl-anhydromuramyl-L-alanine amidase AmpD